MRLKKIVENIEEKVNFLTKDSFHKAKKYEEQNDLLSKITLNVKNAKIFLNNDAQYGLNIEYEIPPIKIYFDDDGQMLKNERFYAINALDLISKEDMQKIQEILNEVIRRNKKL
jgi:hypothetical protein